MTESAPATAEQGRADDRHLRLLCCLHLAMAAMCVAAIGGLLWYYLRVHAALLQLSHPPGRSRGAGSPISDFMGVFNLYYLVAGTALGVFAVANAASGLLIARRRGRTVTLAVAFLNALLVPVGTGLAIAAWVILERATIRRLYAQAAPGGPPAAVVEGPGPAA